MYAWVTALLGALLSLSGIGVNPGNIVGTARLAGPVFVNGRSVSNEALLTNGDRVETGAGGVMVLTLSSTDRLILGEKSSINLRESGSGVLAEVNRGRMQVNTTHRRLKEVRLTDEGISISADPGQPSQYIVSRFANTSYVIANKGSLRMTNDAYGESKVIPEGMAGTAHTAEVHGDPPLPQQVTPVSTGSGRAGSITALNPKGYINSTEASRGKDINFGDQVRTEPTGRMRMVLLDGSILNLGSGSSMTVKNQDPRTSASVTELTAGRVRAKVLHIANPNGQWEIRTSTAICGVLGTDFFVETDGTKTRLIVYEGKVKFTPLDRAMVAVTSSAVTLIAGQTSTAVAGAVASPVAAGAGATSAAAATSIAGQGATAAGTTAATVGASQSIGVVAATAIPAAAGAAVIGATAAGDTGNNPNSNLTVSGSGSTSVVSSTNP
jgi:hypothetical protein